MYLDCHTHLLPPERTAKLMRWIHRALPGHPVPLSTTAESAISDLRRNGALRWANLLFPLVVGEAPSLHTWGARLAEDHPEITPFGGVMADDPDPLGIVQEAIEVFGMAGLKFHPMMQRFVPWDPRLKSVLVYLERQRKPLYIHTGYDAWYGYELDRAGLEAMLGRYAALPVVLPHLGFPDLAWGFGLARRFPNVWLDITNVAGSITQLPAGSEEAETLGRVFTGGLAEYAGRVMMGTDHPAGMSSIEGIFEQLARFDIPESVREEVLVTTAGRFFDRYGRPRP